MIDGSPVKPISDLLKQPDWSAADIEACVQLAGISDDPTLGEMYDRFLSTSCSFFAAEILQGPKEPPYNGKFLLGSHHYEWDELTQRHNRLNILAARDHGKSHFFSFAYPIWKAGYADKGSEGVIFSATQPQAEKFLGKIKEELLTNPKLAHLVPYSGGRFWSAKRITLRNRSVIWAAGFGVKIRGAHPAWCVCDDVLNDDDIYSETVRRKNIDYFLSAIAGMVHRSKPLIVVGTPLHQGDLYAELKAGSEYECREYPALDADNRPLWPERYSLEDLEAKKRELKSAARFAREFMCRPLSDEASLFPAKLFSGPDVRLPYILGLGASYWEKKGCRRYTGVDIAMSAETGGDYFVVITFAVDDHGNRWLANMRRHKGMNFTSQLDEIKEEFYLMRSEMIFIEANQMQRVWSDELIRTSDLPIRKFFTSGIGGRQPLSAWKKGATNVVVNKHQLDRGVPSMRIPLEHRKWRLPRGNEESIEKTDILIGEMGAIGWIDGKVVSVGKHDDVVMSCWMAEMAVRMFGVSTWDFASDPTEDLPAMLPTQAEIEARATPAMIEAEVAVIAALDAGRPVGEVDRDLYFGRIRNVIRDYVERCYDDDNLQQAASGAAELGRLDAVYRFNPYADYVANIGRPEYRDPEELDRLPNPSDLGIG